MDNCLFFVIKGLFKLVLAKMLTSVNLATQCSVTCSMCLNLCSCEQIMVTCQLLCLFVVVALSVSELLVRGLFNASSRWVCT